MTVEEAIRLLQMFPPAARLCRRDEAGCLVEARSFVSQPACVTPGGIAQFTKLPERNTDTVVEAQ